jgi:hypothetical protein
MVARCRRALREEASDRWHVPGGIAEALFVVPLLGALALIALGAISRDSFVRLTSEDGPIEWLEVAAWAIAVPCAAAMSWHLWRHDRRRLPALMYALLVLGGLFVLGEEISWGQRLLGIDTPPAIASRNNQGETTIHNLSIVHAPYRLALFLVGAYGSLLVYAGRGWLRRHWAEGFDLYFPPLFLTSGFLVQAIYRGMRLAWIHEPQTEYWGFAEWPEAWIPIAVAAVAYLNLRRHRLHTDVAAPDLLPKPVSVALPR